MCWSTVHSTVFDCFDCDAQGTIAYAVQRLEEYRNELENRVVRRFDSATAAGDLEAMAECSRIMTEFPRGEDIVTQVRWVHS